MLQGAAELGIANPYKDNNYTNSSLFPKLIVPRKDNNISVGNEYRSFGDPSLDETAVTDKDLGIEKNNLGSVENSPYKITLPDGSIDTKFGYIQKGSIGSGFKWEKDKSHPRWNNEGIYKKDTSTMDMKQEELSSGKINENPSGLETENTPLTKKERTNNILEMLGYDKAKKNALYDAMIKAGQRVSRTGLGADNLVSDVIQDTSTSYDKPEKLREAANLMDVQQQLKLDQIDASKTNKNQEDLAFYTKQFGGGEAGRKKALNFLTKQSSSAVDAYLTKKKETGSGLDGVKGAIEWMIGNGDIKEGENKGEINKKKFDGLSDFLKDPEGFAKTGPGVYQLSGMVVRINADGTTETVQSFGTIDEKTSSWWSK